MEDTSRYREIQIVCYPFGFMNKQPPSQQTDKVVFPNYVIEEIQKQNPDFVTPLLFTIRNPARHTRVSCSVDSFDSPDFTYLPDWMMDFLRLEPGDHCRVIKANFPKIKSVTFKPLQKEFYNLDDPKKNLEAILRNYMTLTLNACITFQMNTQVDGLTLATDVAVKIVDLQPHSSVYIRDSEPDVDFAENPDIAPVYAAPRQPADDEEEFDFNAEPPPAEEPVETFTPFAGEGNRLGRSYDTRTPGTAPAVETVQCPHCLAQVNKANFQIHELRCKRMYNLCPICGQKLLLLNTAAVQEHQAMHMQVPCLQCQKLVEKQYMKEHLETLCPKRLQKCEFCGLMFPVCDMPQHREFCGNVMVECPACGKMVNGKQLAAHQTGDCPFAPHQRQEPQQPQPPAAQAFECPMCGAVQPSEAELNEHMICYHPELFD